MDTVKTNWWWFNGIDNLSSPALMVYAERVRANIRAAVEMAGSAGRLCPHVKTTKSAEAVKLMMDAGITQFKCATIAEAEMLGACGAASVVLACQPVGPVLQRLVCLMQKFPATNWSCITDDRYIAGAIAAATVTAGLHIPVYIDLNVGMNRTGISPGDAAIALYAHCATLEGITPKGWHVYDGHLRDIDLQLRRQKCDAAFAPVEEMNRKLVARGFSEPVVIAGGSPTFPIHCTREKVICSPGTFVYWDKGYLDGCPEQPFLPAVALLTRVISLPTPTTICLDLGHKSVAAENELARRVYFPADPQLRPVGHSEEHLVVEAGSGHSYKVGDVLFGIPFHVCPTVALYERAIAIESAQVAGEWKTVARDRRITC